MNAMKMEVLREMEKLLERRFETYTKRNRPCFKTNLWNCKLSTFTGMFVLI